MNRKPTTSDAVAARRIGWTIGLAALTVIGLIGAAAIAQRSQPDSPAGAVQPGPRDGAVQPRPANPLDGARAYRYLEAICALGPRYSGSPGMRQQQDLLTKHFEQLGGKVTRQEFTAKDPRDGRDVGMANLIVTWHPERQERILICAHYDTRPLPDRDPNPIRRRSGTFIGANDGGSGVAVLMELAHLMPAFDRAVGVDFVLFDGEELVYEADADIELYFLGSEHFAREYVARPPQHKYRWGVLLDMVGDASLQISIEQNSYSWPDTRPLVNQIWGTAQKLGVREFIPRANHFIQDDHLALREIAKIPTCDIIDFDYDPWHTTADTPDKCSPASLAKVGWVVFEWLKTQ
jgi:hypothetical protein